jgi:hypothetical protein
MSLKNEINHFKSLKQFALIACPRSGSDYLQSLIDNHDEVLTFNGSFMPYVEFFYKVEPLNENTNLDKFVSQFIIQYFYKFCSSLDFEEGKNDMGESFNESININIVKLKNIIIEYLNIDGLSYKNFIMAVYYAYNKLIDRNMMLSKCILFHPHNLDEAEFFIKDFDKASLLFSIRDLRAGYLSTVEHLINYNKYEYDNLKHIFITIYRCGVDSDFAIKHNKEHLCVRLEDLPHETTLKKLCEYLQINFSETLLTSTFQGHKWNGDKKQKKIYKDEWSENRTYNNWKLKLSERDINIINILFFKKLKHYCYEVEKPSKYQLIKCFFMILLPFKHEKKFFSFKHISKKMNNKIQSKSSKIFYLFEYIYYLKRIIICYKLFFKYFSKKNFDNTFIKPVKH